MMDVVVGVIGAGRATELHANALRMVSGVNIRLKTVMTRNRVNAENACKRFGFEKYTVNFNDVLDDPEIDVVDLCTPPYTHHDMIIKVLRAGKHVICEKPLCGFFGDGSSDIGDTVSRQEMYESVCRDLDVLKAEVESSGRLFMYAENFVYAPAIRKAADVIAAKHSRILFMKGEESLKGSSSPVAGSWAHTGGGSLIRVGAHPLSAILYLKSVEAKARGTDISVVDVNSNTSRVTDTLTEYEHRHIAARPVDVEDIAVVLLSFSDGSQSCVIATDTLLGGSRNYVEAYCNDATLYCNLTMNNLMETYLLDEDGMDDIGLSEMLPSKCGWNQPFISDEVIRGYAGEMQDFMECIAYGRKPLADFNLAYDTTKIIYAAYLSAQKGAKVTIQGGDNVRSEVSE